MFRWNRTTQKAEKGGRRHLLKAERAQAERDRHSAGPAKALVVVLVVEEGYLLWVKRKRESA